MLFARLVLSSSARLPPLLSLPLYRFVRLPRLSRFALSVPFGFRLRSYLFGPLRLLLLRVPSPDKPSPTVRHLESSAHASDLSSLRCPSSFFGSVRFPGCFALACILQMISFPFSFSSGTQQHSLAHCSFELCALPASCFQAPSCFPPGRFLPGFVCFAFAPQRSILYYPFLCLSNTFLKFLKIFL